MQIKRHLEMTTGLDSLMWIVQWTLPPSKATLYAGLNVPIGCRRQWRHICQLRTHEEVLKHKKDSEQ